MEPSNVVDLDASQIPRSAHSRRNCQEAVLAEILVTTIGHDFTRLPGAVLARWQLPDHVFEVYEQCRPRTPIPAVSSISLHPLRRKSGSAASRLSSKLSPARCGAGFWKSSPSAVDET